MREVQLVIIQLSSAHGCGREKKNKKKIQHESVAYSLSCVLSVIKPNSLAFNSILWSLYLMVFQEAELMEEGMDESPDVLRREFEAYMQERFLAGMDSR